MTTTPTLPSWWQVMQPHQDIRHSKRLDESIVAAGLGHIDADVPDGIEPDVIDLTIKETFKQLGLAPEYQQAG